MKVLKAIGSILLMSLLTILLLTLGIIKPASELLTTKTVSKAVAKKVDKILALAIEGSDDVSTEDGKMAQKVREMVNKAGFSEKVLELAKNEKVKDAVSDFVSSVALSKVDPNVEIVYPSKDALVDAAFECRDQLQEMFHLKVDTSDMSKEELDAVLSKDYDKIMQEFKKFAEAQGED